MKVPLVIIALIVIGGLSIGNVMAANFVDENVTVTRTGSGAAITVQADLAPAIKLNELDTGQIFQFRLTGDGSRLDIIDITNNRVGLSMSSSTGNIGIGISVASHLLDVNGDARIRGNLLVGGNIASFPAGDICIGTCP